MFAAKDTLLTRPSGGYQISRSVRTRASATAYFNRTFTTPTLGTKWTWSGWVKRGTLGSSQTLMAGGSSGNDFSYLGFLAGNTFTVQQFDAGVQTLAWTSTGVFRDTSAWYHVIIQYDSTQATGTNRLSVWVNNTLQAGTYSAGPITQNTLSRINTATTHYINRYFSAANYFDGYLAEANFIDGQALTPSSFGETNAITGVWQPKKYGGTYGTNGFYLNFSDNSTAAALGTDFSGNSNTWTVNNISVTAGATYDSMLDVPTLYADGGNGRGNYAVLNPLWRLGSAGQATPSNGNLTASSLGNNILASTIPLPSTGKWYMEFTLTTGQYADYGIASSSGLGGGSSTGVYGAYYNGSNLFLANGAGGTSDGNQANITSDIGLIAVDVDNNKMWIGRTRSGTTVWMGGGSPSAGTSPSFSASGGGGVYATTFNAQTFNNPFVASGAGADVWNVNFGQRPFTNTPPTGFVALNTQNLPEPTISNGANYMAATTYTGTGSALTIANTVGSASFQPDFVWLKARSAATNNRLYDSVRGANLVLSSNTTDAESTPGGTGGVTAFNSNGFSLGSAGADNASAVTFIGWQWNAGGSTVTNTDGTISAQVRANPTAGFSIVTYNAVASGASTVGHGLGVAPMLVINKGLDALGSDWLTYHVSLAATTFLNLRTTAAAATNAAVYPSAPSSTVVNLGTGMISGNYGTRQLLYCFAEVAGYSAFGSYTGNGSADGPFVYLGFRPRWLMIKRSSTASVTYGWQMYDTSRQPANTASSDPNLWADTSAAEGTGNYTFDLLSNGFKLRSSGVNENASGNTYIYAAFAENPFKLSLAR